MTKVSRRELCLLQTLQAGTWTVNLPSDARLLVVEQSAQPADCDIYIVPCCYLLYLTDTDTVETKDFTLVILEANGITQHPVDKLRYINNLNYQGRYFMFFELDMKSFVLKTDGVERVRVAEE